MAVYLPTRKRTIRVKSKLISSAYITNSMKGGFRETFQSEKGFTR
jgi:hypothetical protein